MVQRTKLIRIFLELGLDTPGLKYKNHKEGKVWFIPRHRGQGSLHHARIQTCPCTLVVRNTVEDCGLLWSPGPLVSTLPRGSVLCPYTHTYTSTRPFVCLMLIVIRKSCNHAFEKGEHTSKHATTTCCQLSQTSTDIESKNEIRKKGRPSPIPRDDQPLYITDHGLVSSDM